MNRKEEIKRIWSECFNDSREYVDMYFDRVYNDADGMLLERNGKVVSSLLLQRYAMLIGSREVCVSYVAGAATRRSARGNGYMSQLMCEALIASRERGDMLCTLIPAHDWLYFFYDRFDFSTVFYVDRQRFTSLHAFSGEGDFHSVDYAFSDDVYRAFSDMERSRDGMVLHSKRDFLNILDDLRMDPDGRFVVMADDHDDVAAMAWATATPHMVTVRELLGRDDGARKAALRELRRHYPDRPFTVLAPAADGSRRLYARGMGRIVNVELCLSALAASAPQWASVIKVTDRLMPANSHIYRVESGAVTIDDSYTGHLDLDVTLEVLNRLVFSSPRMGEIIGIPSVRPHLSLMLD